ncbi:MAG: exopolysaccharide biosynthesis protein [Armatimonadota bacterium]|nr:exopolysaccharide biosynthesis protein [Armatimonadota bacterium]MDR7484933.1 exopolysaccharide biosynthesis protein [Armatimonadota bacterium]MDR7534621.1 exopolysaccharide biosynthesis protein [Armatimonadota bacterium]MDR7535447.1 exopolysaccharide biosynthesis protein [Armatimonadota bacterium]
MAANAPTDAEIPSLSSILEGALTRAGPHPLRLGDLLDETAERGFGLLMLLLGLPMLIPVLPPGSSTVVGPIYAVFAIQMLRGSGRPWLPRSLQNRTLSPRAVQLLRDRGLPMIRAIERWSRPRGFWPGERVGVRIVAVAMLFMGLILLGPFPFLNTPPAVAVMLLGVALLNRDVVFLLAGLAVAAVSVGILLVTVGLLVSLLAFLRAVLP